ncbi:MAG: hypothetical protein AAF296_00805 [Pseudomonadota bacterium]
MSVIRLDLSALQKSGDLNDSEAVRLSQLALPEQSGATWISALLIFGALGVAAGVLALEPSAITGLMLALTALGLAGWLKFFQRDESWQLLGSAFAIMGTIGLGGWIAAETYEVNQLLWPPFAIFAITTAGAVLYRSAFLSALAVLAFAALLGSGTGYWHASYMLIVRESFITIAAFGLITLGLYQLRGRIADTWTSLSTVAARTSFIMVNFGFWVGSLWGDHIGEHWAAGDDWRARSEWRENSVFIEDWVFSLGWAALLIAIFVRAPRGGFLSITSLVFFAIHAYTQFFETFQDSAAALVIGGFIMIALAVIGARLAMGRTTAIQQSP